MQTTRSIRSFNVSSTNGASRPSPTTSSIINQYRKIQYQPTRSNAIRKSILAKSTQTSDTAVSTSQVANWASFAEAVSGEWDGVTATFDYDGEAQQLPEYYVPQAFRDWGVYLYDWQSQCSMSATNEGLKYALRRLMPTVGCEADAIAFTEESSNAADTAIAIDSPALFYDAQGGYNLIHGDFGDAQCFKAAVEHCIPTGTKQRLRAVHRFQRARAGDPWKLFYIELHREKWDRPQDGKQELGGCGGGMPTFAQDPVLDIDLQSTSWSVVQGTTLNGADIQGRSWERGVDIAKQGSVVKFPGAWSGVVMNGTDGIDVCIGTVLEDGTMKVSRRHIGGDGSNAASELLTLQK